MTHAEPSTPVMTADAGYPVRNSGFVMQWNERRLCLRSEREKAQCWLNETAAAIWLMCDGQARVEELLDRLQSCYPDQSAEVRSDVLESLADLRVRGLVWSDVQPQPARPLLQVGFAGFGPAFRGDDNYFLWMLAQGFDVILVDPEQDMPDLLLYRDPPVGRFDHHRVDRDRTIKIVISADGGPPDFSQCDYAFSPDPVDGAFAGRHCELPVWCVYLDWDAYAKSELTFSERRLPAEYRPEQVCARLRDALFLSAVAEAVANPEPSPHTPGHPVAEHPVISPGVSRKLTIGMATYDDFDGVYFTVQAIRLFHPEVADNIEILIIDNHPEGSCAQHLKQLADGIPGCRYVPCGEVRSTAARDLVFREARGEVVLCVDSHVLLAPGAICWLLAFLDAHPESRDLLQGPLVHDDLSSVSTHFDPVWSQGMYGKWGVDERGNNPENDPFEIPMQGLGVFACRKEAWLGFNPRFLGFGGEEGYLHEKFRQAGQRNLCLPFLRWTHRFQRPFGAGYRNVWEDRIRNYYIGFQELKLDPTPIDEHFAALLGSETFERIKHQVSEELANPFFYFDAIYCINLDTAHGRWQAMQERFRRLGILHRVRRFSAVATPEFQHIGCALSHRGIIQQARKQQLQNVLVFEDDAIFLEETLSHLARSIEELKEQPWKVFHLGGHKWGRQFPRAEGCRFLESPCRELTCSHAVAYHHSIFQTIMDDLPDEIDAMKGWISSHAGIDQYLRQVPERYLAFPVVSSQPFLLPQEDAAHRDKFTI